MVRFFSIADAEARFAELVRSLSSEDQIVLNDGVRAVARILPPHGAGGPLAPGQHQGVANIAVRSSIADLDALIRALPPGGEISLTDETGEVARLVAPPAVRAPRKPGSLKGMLRIIDDSDDIILEHFKDYV